MKEVKTTFDANRFNIDDVLDYIKFVKKNKKKKKGDKKNG